MKHAANWRSAILLGVGFGLASGFLETLARLFRKLAFGEQLHLGAYVGWMPAAANGVLLGLVGAVLGLISTLWPRVLSRRLLVGTLAWLAWLDVVWLWSPPLALYAVVALALGLAVQTTRLLSRDWDGFDRAVRRTVPALLLAVLAIGSGIELLRARFERSAWGNTAASRTRPNVLVLLLDTVRTMNLGAYGYFRATTPTMSRVAARGVRFERVIAPAPWTLPSHAAVFTGRWMHEQSTGWRKPLDGRWPTVAEALRDEGYLTAGFVANTAYCDRENGLSRGFAHWEDYPLNWRQALRSSQLGLWLSRRPVLNRRFGPGAVWTLKVAGQITQDFLDWHEGRRDERPWFGFINFLDAHGTYTAPRSFDTLFTGDSAVRPQVPLQPAPGATGSDLRPAPIERYDRAIRYIDEEIGRVLDELDRRGDLANTIVIITSDHGEEFVEHGVAGHGSSLYFPSLSVPLVLAGPAELPAGVTVPATVSLRELAPTILDLSGSTRRDFPGASLARFWRPITTPMAPDTVFAELNYAWYKPTWHPTSKGDMKSVFVGSHHLIRNGDGSYEYYDLSSDNWEQSERGTDPALGTTISVLREALERLPAPIKDTRRPEAARQ